MRRSVASATSRRSAKNGSSTSAYNRFLTRPNNLPVIWRNSEQTRRGSFATPASRHADHCPSISEKAEALATRSGAEALLRPAFDHIDDVDGSVALASNK